jgi:pimeloyl-ACP methyl ester carboxylesterase
MTTNAITATTATAGPDRPWRRRLLRAVAGIVALLVILIYGVVPYWMTGQFMNARHAFPDPDADVTPATFQLPFEEVTLSTSDGLSLSGWWIPAAEARGSAVLVHGANRSRAEMIGKVPFLHAQGLNVLVFDARHHGRSAGDVSTFGYKERLDVCAAVAEARRRSSGPVVAWGISLGAAAVLLAAAEDPGIAGVVSDAAYRSLPDTVRHHAELARNWKPWLKPLPAGPLAEGALFWIRRRGGFDPADVDIVRAAGQLGARPALFVANAGDKRMPMEIAFELQQAAGPHARVLVVPGHSHGRSYHEATAAYEQAVTGLLKEVLAAGPATSRTGGTT